MKVYLTDSQVPELKDVPPKVARTVLMLAVDLMRSDTKLLTELPILFCALGAPLGSYVGGWAVGTLGLARPLGGEWAGCYVGLCIGGVLGGFIGQQMRIPILRRYLRRAVDELTSEVPRSLNRLTKPCTRTRR
jgi:hypothetical protein